jgi:hypothetical protein
VSMLLCVVRRRLAVRDRNAALCCLFTLTGCGDASLGDAQGRVEQRVVNAQPSPASQNAVVAVYYEKPGKATWATGTIVAPNVVLTSKQLLFDAGPQDPVDSIECDDNSVGSPVGQARDPADFLVMFGEKLPMRATARGTRVHGSGVLDFCKDDVALLEIDTEFPIAPVPIRLNGLPLQDEQGLLIGWGLTDDRLRSPEGSYPSLMGKRQQTELKILTIGPDDFPVSHGAVWVNEDTFVAGEGGCYGDAGAPFLSMETGAIIGTLTSFEPDDLTAAFVGDAVDCYGSHGIFRTLSAGREWLLGTLRDVGKAPSIEGLRAPGVSGDACTDDAECMSGRCLTASVGGFCTVSCDAASCPMGQQCLTVDDQQWCVPERLDQEDSDSTACSVSFSPRASRSSALSLIASVFALCWLRRRRNASRRCESTEERR